MLERQSALAGVLSAGGRDGAAGGRACRIGEREIGSLFQVAGFTHTKVAVDKVLTAVLGKKPPANIGTAVLADGRTIFRTGPEQHWIAGPQRDDLEAKLMATLPPVLSAVTDLSHSRSRIFIEGPAAREVLSRGIALDLHPAQFGPGRFALTGLHHTPVLLYRATADDYEIWAMRTFAHTVWDWLADAALPFGYDIAPPAR